jgi:hypothetical protein
MFDQDKKGRANPQKETEVKAMMHRKIKLGTVLIMLDTGQQVQCNAMLDNGCETTSIDRDWVRSKGLNTFPLRERIVIRNADGTINEDGTCTSILQARLCIGWHEEIIEPLIMKLGGDCPLFLGLDWFKKHNPEVDWQEGRIQFARCPRTCAIKNVAIEDEPEEKEEEKEEDDCPELQEDDSDDEEEKDTNEPTPDYFKEFPNVFTEQEHIPLAPHREFDHEIKLTDNEPVAFKLYPMTKEEREHLKKWIEGSLENGQYQPSKSQYASPMFFKHETNPDGTKKLCPLVDYRALNAKTVRDQHPLPNMRIVAEELKDGKYFTKMDVRWGYYNVWIKEGDEYKAAIITPDGLFEPTVV